MKSIILFRHCKPKGGGFGRDHDRPLDFLGISDAKKMGLYLAGKNELPELVISSTAIRSKNTAEVAMSEGKWHCPLRLNPYIYGGDPLFLLSLSNNQDNSFSSICMIGHEPSFSNFISRLTENYYQVFPHGSMARIDFDVEGWVDIEIGSGNLRWQLEPGDIKQ